MYISRACLEMRHVLYYNRKDDYFPDLERMIPMKKRLMKLFSIILSFALSFTFFGTVSFARYSGTDPTWDQYSSDYYYRQMNAEQKELYDRLYEKCMELLTTEKDCTNIEEGEYYTDYVEYDESLGSIERKGLVTTTAYTFANSNPQFYFLAGDSIYGYYTRTGASHYRYYLCIRVYDEFADGSDRADYTERFSASVNRYMAEVNLGRSAYDKERIAHNIITRKLSYDENANFDQSSASAFLTNSSVCAGYSEGLELLLNGAGFECIPVTSESHEWLQVKLDGTWYAVDVTWDDPDGFFAFPTEEYLNVSDATLLEADKESYDTKGVHVPESYYKQLNRPACNYDYPDSDPNAKPDDPVEPEDPDDPENPDPVDPKDPENPDDPGVPDPVDPEDPENPDPTDPEDPENPDPVNPDPVDPDPAKPEPDGTGADDYGESGTYANKDGYIALFRLYNPNSGEHFYTTNVAERRSLIAEYGWRGEGIIGYFPADPNLESKAMFRFYNPNAGDHHYASDPVEIRNILIAGWEPESISFYSLREGAGIPIYRLYNPNAVTGTHHYTSDKAEKDRLVSLGWRDEGISWYAAA